MAQLNDNEMKIQSNLENALALIEEARILAIKERGNKENRHAWKYQVMPNDLLTAISSIKIAQRSME